MYAAKRAKRDTAENIYRNCQISGNCPPDVVNKIEQKTWADVLLQAFSSIIYFGNLGIGTGKGTVGARPLPAGTRTIPETIAPPSGPRITRPSVTRQTRPFSVPLDTIGVGSRPVDPLGSRPIDVLNPTSPAIVPLNEALPDTVITVGEGTLPDLNVVTDTVSINGHPTIFQSPDNDIAILNVTPADPPPTRVIFQAETINPTFSVESAVGHIEPVYDIFVDPLGSAHTITYGEEIPLEPLRPRAEFEIEDLPRASTPSDRVSRIYNRAREFYRRRVQQMPTRNPNLLGDVSRAIVFRYENPAFESEISLQFEQALDEVTAAPDPDFAGIQKIGRPYLSKTQNRTVRVSRLGSRAGIQTRRGTVIGQDIHFYYDISPIPQIELSTFSNSSVLSTEEPLTLETVLDSTVVGDMSNASQDLLDMYAEDFNNAHLVFPSMDERDETVLVPALYSNVIANPSVIDIAQGYFVSNETPGSGNIVIPNATIIPFIPNISTVVSGNDFILHPSLMSKKKRKRSDSF
uniref:Minor capsid protein L2 n=1 Tax=Human papillomavirus TaxID=10566 RepID=A0A385PKJ0_9PAPI|nr:MAG: L2 protein [Human papillomavirus]